MLRDTGEINILGHDFVLVLLRSYKLWAVTICWLGARGGLKYVTRAAAPGLMFPSGGLQRVSGSSIGYQYAERHSKRNDSLAEIKSVMIRLNTGEDLTAIRRPSLADGWDRALFCFRSNFLSHHQN